MPFRRKLSPSASFVRALQAAQDDAHRARRTADLYRREADALRAHLEAVIQGVGTAPGLVNHVSREGVTIFEDAPHKLWVPLQTALTDARHYLGQDR